MGVLQMALDVGGHPRAHKRLADLTDKLVDGLWQGAVPRRKNLQREAVHVLNVGLEVALAGQAGGAEAAAEAALLQVPRLAALSTLNRDAGFILL